MKQKHYHYFDHDGEERITVVVLITKENIIARGVSICSKQDVFDEADGIERAKNSALRAAKKRKIEKVINRDAVKALIECNCPWDKKGYINPDLTFFEKHLIYGYSLKPKEVKVKSGPGKWKTVTGCTKRNNRASCFLKFKVKYHNPEIKGETLFDISGNKIWISNKIIRSIKNHAVEVPVDYAEQRCLI